MKFKFGVILSLSLLFITDFTKTAEMNFEYPELSVVPSTCERGEVERAHERSHALQTQFPFLVLARAGS